MKKRTKEKQKLSFITLFKLVFKYSGESKTKFWLAVLFSFFHAIFYAIGSFLIGYIFTICLTKDVLDHKTPFNLKLFIGMASCLVISFILYGIFRYVSGVFFVKITFSVCENIRKTAIKNLLYIPVSYFDNQKSGNIISILVNDINSLSETIFKLLNELIQCAINVILSVIFLSMVSLVLSAVVLPVLFLFSFIGILITKKAQKAFIQTRKHFGELNAFVEEMLTNSKIIKTFEQQEQVNNHGKQIARNIFNTAFTGDLNNQIINPWIVFTNNILVILIVTVTLVLKGNNIHVYGLFNTNAEHGFLISYLTLIYSFLSTLQSMLTILVYARIGIASAVRVNTLLSLPNTHIKNHSKGIVIENPVGNISFDHVYFRYNENSPKYQLTDASFNAKAGQTIALVGETGAGKTTIINLLNRFYDYEKGSIKIDGIELREISKDSLRDFTAVVLQDSFMFNESILNNLLVGNPKATKEDVIRAAKLASAHHIIEKLEHGYDTIIDDSTSILSKGEKQLLSIARAILGNKKILILDEATSNVDSNTEKIIQQALKENIMVGKTSIVIAHRLSTIKNADLILVVDDGRIIEQGTHKQLLELNKKYARLYYSQFDD